MKTLHFASSCPVVCEQAVRNNTSFARVFPFRDSGVCDRFLGSSTYFIGFLGAYPSLMGFGDLQAVARHMLRVRLMAVSVLCVCVRRCRGRVDPRQALERHSWGGITLCSLHTRWAMPARRPSKADRPSIRSSLRRLFLPCYHGKGGERHSRQWDPCATAWDGVSPLASPAQMPGSLHCLDHLSRPVPLGAPRWRCLPWRSFPAAWGACRVASPDHDSHQDAHS